MWYSITYVRLLLFIAAGNVTNSQKVLKGTISELTRFLTVLLIIKISFSLQYSVCKTFKHLQHTFTKKCIDLERATTARYSPPAACTRSTVSSARPSSSAPSPGRRWPGSSPGQTWSAGWRLSGSTHNLQPCCSAWRWTQDSWNELIRLNIAQDCSLDKCTQYGLYVQIPNLWVKWNIRQLILYVDRKQIYVNYLTTDG